VVGRWRLCGRTDSDVASRCEREIEAAQSFSFSLGNLILGGFGGFGGLSLPDPFQGSFTEPALANSGAAANVRTAGAA
jgi:hypothetical protein